MIAITCPACTNLNPPAARECSRCGAELTATGERGLEVGDRIDRRYRLEALLGQGGMGTVFAAVDEKLDRKVALKILNADLVTNKKARERLETEARLLARLQHPNVLAIYDLLDVHNSLALVLEHMPGGTLADRLREQRPSVEQVVTWMTSLLAGMEAVHEAKLVHRDIKPQNVLLTAKGIPKLADLGIARDTQSRGMTKTGARMGTAEYMSPEQIRGVVVDASSDIYACGIVLYELLTGSVPFAGDSEWKVMSGHMNGALDLSQLAGCPTHLVKAIERAMQKQPEARWGSAAEFSRALLVAGPAAAMGRKIQVAKRVSEAKVYDVEAPGDLGRKCVAHLDDRWCMIPTSKSSCNFGCSSHMDPQDSYKSKEGFSFALELRVPSATWMVAGVADGVEHSTWSKRGAKHASAAFIESVAIAVHANVPFDDSLWAHLQREVAREFHQNLMQRLRQDEERIVREGQVAPAWSVQPYRDRFFSPEGAKHRRAWFQSTLLATALGPHGGFALLLGDGLIRVDRLRRGHWDAPTLAKLSAEVVSSFYLTEEQVECSLVPIRAKDAEKIAVLMATHGVEKSSKQALDGKDWPQLGIKSASDCETYLLDLADRPKDQVEWGNMSLAFVERDVE